MRIFRIASFISLSLCFFLNSGFPQTGSAGATGLAFLKVGVGARANGMGEAYTAVVNDATATFWNPAALTHLTRSQLAFTHSEWIQDISNEFLAFAFPAFGGVTGVSINFSHVGGIERRVNPGESLGAIEANDVALGISYGRSLSSSLQVGVTVKYLYEKIYLESASGYAFDFGLNVQPFGSKLNFALAAQNLGAMDELLSDSIDLPETLRFGAAYSFPLEALEGAVVLAAEGVKVVENDLRGSFGAEVQLKKILALRLGYQSGYEDRSLAGGFGFSFQRYHLDYGYTPFGSNLGDSHRFSFGLDL